MVETGKGGPWRGKMLSVLKKAGWSTFHDVILKDEREHTHQIDIVAISKKGILVIEVKNFAGRVYGKEESKEWIQWVGKKKSSFVSPLIQNGTHVRELEKALGRKSRGLVVFAGDNETTGVKNVIGISKLRKWLDRFQMEPPLQNDDLADLEAKLKAANRIDISDRAHRKALKKRNKALKRTTAARAAVPLLNGSRGLTVPIGSAVTRTASSGFPRNQ